jgi:hypothetical protein
MITHGGAVFGAIARVVILPDRNVAFAIMMNSEDSGLMLGLTYMLVDHYLGLPDPGWIELWENWYQSRLRAGAEAVARSAATPARVGPSLPLERYAGRYRDPWYGDVVIGRGPGGLTVDFTTNPGMTGRLRHWQYDSFVTVFDDPGIEPAHVTFSLDADGRVRAVSLRRVNPFADFSWNYQDLDLRPVEGGK